MRARTSLTTSLALLLVTLPPLSGCTGSSTTAPPERHRNAIAEVDEAAIQAALVDDGVELLVPVHRLRSSGNLMGHLTIALVDVAAGEPALLASGTVEVSQSVGTELHRVVLAGVGHDLERTEAASMVIDWSLDLSRDDLYGHRSLYGALGNLDVRLRGPSELPAVGGSPLRVVVRDPRTNTAVNDAAVVATLLTDTVETELFAGHTDARGELVEDVVLPDGVDAGSIRVTVSHDDAQVWTTRSVTRRLDGQAYLGTDKTIYKPGQNIHLRMLALGTTDRLPVVDHEVVFEAEDAKGNKVFRRRSRTDAFGVASTIVPTDTRVNEGDWTLSATIDGRRSVLTIPVQPYNLPKMRVDVTTESEFALPGEIVRGHLSAAYLFGEPVTDAAVTLTARTAGGVTLPALAGRTDGEGQMAFELTVPQEVRTAALEDSGDSLLVSAEVTDAADQVEQGEGVVPLAAAPLRIHLLADPLTPGAESPAWIVVTDPLGRPLRATLALTGAGSGSLETSASGVAEARIEAAAEGDTVVDVTAVDGAGRQHARSFTLAAAGGERLELSTDKAIYRAGDHALVDVRAPAGVTRAYLDAYRGAAGVLSTAVDLVDGHAQLDLPVTEDQGGLLVLDALAIAASGETLRRSRPILVERDDALRITLTPEREQYRPGEEARVDLRVQDDAGSPQVASVGLTVVDEAAFALGGEPTTSLRRSFGLDPRVLPPTANVAGRGADDLLNLPDPTEREELARLLFVSAGDVAVPNFDYDSLAEELPQVQSRLSQKVSWDTAQHLERLRPLIEDGWLSADGLAERLQRASWIDPFGRPYHLTVTGTDEWSLTLSVTSDGPDERAGTADDVATATSLSFLFYDARAVDDADWGGEAPMAGEGGGDADADADADADVPAEPDKAAGRVRSDFRETAYVNPTLITDADGRASITVPLAHSITTWRVSADGSTAGGRIGSARQSLRTFQEFFVDFTLPTKLTSGDELEVPAVVYNYLAEATSVSVTIDDGDWFELLSSPTQTLDLGPSEVRRAPFRIRVAHAGAHALTIRATAGALTDGMVRTVNVDPAGQPEDESVSGQLGEGGATHVLHLPADTVEGGASVELVLTPGFAAEAVQGMDALLQEPNGCFEQTTSSAWPNTLVAHYMDETGQLTPEKREEVVALVTRGYQRLLTFESPTGGFNWWGDEEPGNRILSAIMLWHLADLETLIEVDQGVRERTLAWLVSQQQADGSWESGDALHAGNETLGTSKERTTAFIAWALAHTGLAEDVVARAIDWLRANEPPESDLYANALAANALAFTDPNSATAQDLFARLDDAKQARDDDRLLWPTAEPSWTGAEGDTAAIETTGLVAYGLMQAQAYPEDAAGAMRFLLASKDAVGTWYNTQATMNALRALSAAVEGGGGDGLGTVRLTVNGVLAEEITVDEDNRDLTRRFDVTDLAHTGDNDLALELVGTGEVSYRLTRRAYRPALPGAVGPLSLTVTYDVHETQVGLPVTAVARATNDDPGTRDQVIVQVGRAPGFEPMREDLDALVAAGVAARYEVRTDDVTFYLMGLESGETRELSFRMIPGLVVDATAPASTVYAYYEPSLRQVVDAEHFVVTAAP